MDRSLYETSPRDGCDVVAVWKETGDPMLAVGKFDNGRVLAYTSDPAPHWGCNFVYWQQYNQFWINALNWLLAKHDADSVIAGRGIMDGDRTAF